MAVRSAILRPTVPVPEYISRSVPSSYSLAIHTRWGDRAFGNAGARHVYGVAKIANYVVERWRGKDVFVASDNATAVAELLARVQALQRCTPMHAHATSVCTEANATHLARVYTLPIQRTHFERSGATKAKRLETLVEFEQFFHVTEEILMSRNNSNFPRLQAVLSSATGGRVRLLENDFFRENATDDTDWMLRTPPPRRFC